MTNWRSQRNREASSNKTRANDCNGRLDPRFSTRATSAGLAGFARIALIAVLACVSSACSDDDPSGGGGAPTGTSSNGGHGGGGGRGDGPHRVFVTKATFTGDLQSAGTKGDGVSGADALCTTAAQNLGGVWKAWLSGKRDPETVVDAIHRLDDFGPWYLVDGTTLVFESKEAMLSPPQHPIDMAEDGSIVSEGLDPRESVTVWTGTTHDGTFNGFGSSCAPLPEETGAWSTANAEEDGLIGLIWDYTIPDPSDIWTHWFPAPCDGSHHVYCFEQ